MKWIRIFENWSEAEERLPQESVVELNIGSLPLAIVRQKSELFIFERNCPHQRAPLTGATLNGFHEIICPLHEFRFHLKSGRESGGRCRDLRLYPVKIEQGVFIGIKN
jgi:nitrite reductase/ring-hydroxylating ferredoxin subunit